MTKSSWRLHFLGLLLRVMCPLKVQRQIWVPRGCLGEQSLLLPSSQLLDLFVWRSLTQGPHMCLRPHWLCLGLLPAGFILFGLCRARTAWCAGQEGGGGESSLLPHTSHLWVARLILPVSSVGTMDQNGDQGPLRLPFKKKTIGCGGTCLSSQHSGRWITSSRLAWTT